MNASANAAYKQYMDDFKANGLWTPKTRGVQPQDHDASIEMRCGGAVGHHHIYSRGNAVAAKCKDVLVFFEKAMRVGLPGRYSYDPPSGETEEAQWDFKELVLERTQIKTHTLGCTHAQDFLLNLSLLV